MRALRRIGALSLLLLAACPGPGPGSGPKAERGYAAATPVIAALERHRELNGAYPDSLPQLVPDLLRAEALDPPNAGYPFLYRRTDAGYELRFRWSGPGMNTCTWTPASAAWKCSGYY
jgi:hypothetical protein